MVIPERDGRTDGRTTFYIIVIVIGDLKVAIIAVPKCKTCGDSPSNPSHVQSKCQNMLKNELFELIDFRPPGTLAVQSNGRAIQAGIN